MKVGQEDAVIPTIPLTEDEAREHRLKILLETVKSPAKKELLLLLHKTKINEDYTFRFEGNEHDAIRFVHGMRVELSRLRAKIMQRGKAPKPFKLLLKLITTNGVSCNVTLARALNMSDSQAQNTVDAIFDEIAGGNLIKKGA